MARLIYSERALADLERLTDFLADTDPGAAEATVDLIEEAVSTLARHPMIGRPVEYGLRELVISRGRTGYMALYSFDEHRDDVLVLAIRHQREAGCGTHTPDA
ncbi:MAG TPA: type II toxin-antitoxin system RelE/ParE family toxin [Rhodocyclaceae bacterium]|nr:type II toxin-antitoxin system RelE/ParE family toxin [Rhodocyclaceae bacterium]